MQYNLFFANKTVLYCFFFYFLSKVSLTKFCELTFAFINWRFRQQKYKISYRNFLEIRDLKENSPASFDIKVTTSFLLKHFCADYSAFSGSKIVIKWSFAIVAIFYDTIFRRNGPFHWNVIISRNKSSRNKYHWNDFHIDDLEVNDQSDNL